MKTPRVGLVLGIVALSSTSLLRAWDSHGHQVVTLEAVELLAGELPEFLQEDRNQLAWDSIEPDLMRNDALPHLRDREAPDHYLNVELLRGGELPETRADFLRSIDRPGTDTGVEQVGALPFAIVEATQRLTLAFALYRQQPSSRHLQAKAIINAAHLAHYAEDLCQPLHTTIHYDGRAVEGGSSPYTGIHQQVDRLIGRLEPQEEVSFEGLEPRELEPLFAAVIEELERSHSQVERLYGLEEDLVALEAGGEPSSELRSFTRERFRAAVLFSASLILTAWQDSEALHLPDWGLPDPAPGLHPR